MLFEENERVTALVLDPFVLNNPEEGLHWFRVSIDGHLLTEVPLRITRFTQESQPSGHQ